MREHSILLIPATYHHPLAKRQGRQDNPPAVPWEGKTVFARSLQYSRYVFVHHIGPIDSCLRRPGVAFCSQLRYFTSKCELGVSFCVCRQSSLGQNHACQPGGIEWLFLSATNVAILLMCRPLPISVHPVNSPVSLLMCPAIFRSAGGRVRATSILKFIKKATKPKNRFAIGDPDFPGLPHPAPGFLSCISRLSPRIV